MKAKSDKKVVKNTSAKSKQKSQKMTMQEMIEKWPAWWRRRPSHISKHNPRPAPSRRTKRTGRQPTFS